MSPGPFPSSLTSVLSVIRGSCYRYTPVSAAHTSADFQSSFRFCLSRVGSFLALCSASGGSCQAYFLFFCGFLVRWFFFFVIVFDFHEYVLWIRIIFVLWNVRQFRFIWYVKIYFKWHMFGRNSGHRNGIFVLGACVPITADLMYGELYLPTFSAAELASIGWNMWYRAPLRQANGLCLSLFPPLTLVSIGIFVCNNYFCGFPNGSFYFQYSWFIHCHSYIYFWDWSYIPKAGP